MSSVYGKLVGLSRTFAVSFFLKSGILVENEMNYRYNSGIIRTGDVEIDILCAT